MSTWKGPCNRCAYYVAVTDIRLAHVGFQSVQTRLQGAILIVYPVLTFDPLRFQFDLTGSHYRRIIFRNGRGTVA